MPPFLITLANPLSGTLALLLGQARSIPEGCRCHLHPEARPRPEGEDGLPAFETGYHDSAGEIIGKGSQ